MSDTFTKDHWSQAWTKLRGVSQAWWETHQDVLVGIAKDEAEDIFRALRGGRTDEARMAIIASMSREEWRAYRDGTTEALRDVAARRAALLDALEDLGRRIAKIIGRAALTALGVP